MRSSSGPSYPRLPLVGLLVWCVAFAAPHVAWALGSRVGLGDQAAAADAAFDRPWFAAYNAVTVVACVVGAAFASWWLRRRRGPGTLQRRALLVVAGVLALRAALGWVGLTADALRGTVDTTWLLVGVELWFMLGALLLLLVARRSAAP